MQFCNFQDELLISFFEAAEGHFGVSGQLL